MRCPDPTPHIVSRRSQWLGTPFTTDGQRASLIRSESWEPVEMGLIPVFPTWTVHRTASGERRVHPSVLTALSETDSYASDKSARDPSGPSNSTAD
jgi:hypothetical protein